MYGQYILHKIPDFCRELEDFKKHFDSCLSSSNLLLNSVIAHIRQKNEDDAPDSGFACGEAVQ